MLTVSVGLLFIQSSGTAPLDTWFSRKKYSAIEEYILSEIEQDDLKDAEQALHYNNLAWLYATSTDAEFRRPGTALRYAEKAVAITNRIIDEGGLNEKKRAVYTLPTYLDTLAMAHYATGDINAALEHSNRALEMCPPGHPSYEEIAGNNDRFVEAVRYGDAHI
jgi:tetratricopeptide (TPR) repeat protein